MVEEHSLLPTNHFRARKKRLLSFRKYLLDPQSQPVIRQRKVLSLISFNIKGAYNSVCKDRLI
ncbi:hypothetical protein BU23DRAFT_662794 [Bimuria novae-zelandiae CBS 107.79]|uniref:Reverse transcriptase domain-containing protein n=1 Tax=Bimuria novae-zelandiae CBS 107.79 TaxID=1447943 RepID=A0A6A5VJ06_9PLEO|nr:hypothetical protein BU23DRAFT_662794 [Bimuria novae-zelandiae CBS 107.79]